MVIDRLAPSMAQLMDREAVRDAAFCHRHREVTREHGKELAAQRLEEAKRTGAEWVTLFDDVTPLGAQRLEMHVRSGRALHTSTEPAARRHAPGRGSSRSSSSIPTTASGCWTSRRC